MKRAFTLVEVVFVIVVLGILAGIAAPKLFATRDDATITKTRADIASIRSSIINAHNTNTLRGEFSYPDLEGADTTTLFDNVLKSGIAPSASAGWSSSVTNQYVFTLKNHKTTFTYNKDEGSFNCSPADYLCIQLTR
ncbi:prepilin-type N-terminal cleavage/methylation domain-containing protein [Campylobacter sp. MOP7]|uniref:prepilin-type N-terminal cleavage/methylation domain-containing protein n=1 Tax=Campylobacter canis TaxID=3378588 RepID=UPI00387E4C36